MIDIHLYGKLRKYSDDLNPTTPSIASVLWEAGDAVGKVIGRLGIPLTEVGSNVFLNGRYANLESPVHDGDRLGLFPDDMQLLYKWYFAPQNTAGAPQHPAGDPNQASGDSNEAIGPQSESRGPPFRHIRQVRANASRRHPVSCRSRIDKLIEGSRSQVSYPREGSSPGHHQWLRYA